MTRSPSSATRTLEAAEALLAEIAEAAAAARFLEAGEYDDPFAFADGFVNNLPAIAYALGAGLPVTEWETARKNPNEAERVLRAVRQWNEEARWLILLLAAGALTIDGFYNRLVDAYRRQSRNSYTAGRRAMGDLSPLADDEEEDLGRLMADDVARLRALQGDEMSVGALIAAILLDPTNYFGSGLPGDPFAPKAKAAAAKGLNKITNRLEQYGDTIRGYSNRGEMSALSRAFDGNAGYAWWTLGPADHCIDCVRLSDLSPFTISQLESAGIYPGSGHTRCGGRCYCRIEYDIPSQICTDPFRGEGLADFGLGGEFTEGPGGLLLPTPDRGRVNVWIQEAASCAAPVSIRSLGYAGDFETIGAEDAFSWSSDLQAQILGRLDESVDWAAVSRLLSARFDDVARAAPDGLRSAKVATYRLPSVDAEYRAIWRDTADAVRFEAGAVTGGVPVVDADFTMRAIRDLGERAAASGRRLEISGEFANPGMRRWLDTLGAETVDLGATPRVIPQYAVRPQYGVAPLTRPSTMVEGIPVPESWLKGYAPETGGRVADPSALIQPGFTPAATKEEALERLAELHPNLRSPLSQTFGKASLDQLNAALAGAERLRDFGTDLAQIRMLGDYSTIPSYIKKRGYNGITIGGQNIGINQSGRYLPTTRPMRAPTLAGNSVADTYRHEVGHVLTAGMDYEQRAALENIWLANKARIDYEVSEYATENFGEWIAEVFESITTPGYNPGSIPYDRAFWQVFEEASAVAKGSFPGPPALLGQPPVPKPVTQKLRLSPIPDEVNALPSWPDLSRLKPDTPAAVKALGGTDPKQLLVDPAGNRWLFKLDNGPAEAAATRLGHAMGLRIPPARIATIGDQRGVLIPMVPGVETLTIRTAPLQPKSAADLASALTDPQAAELTRQSVLDFVLANADSHPGNWLVDASDRLWGIDRGLAIRGAVATSPNPASFWPGKAVFGTAIDAPDVSRILLKVDPDDVARALDALDAIDDARFLSLIGDEAIDTVATMGDRAAKQAALLKRKAAARKGYETLFRDAVDKASASSVSPRWQAWRLEGGIFPRNAAPSIDTLIPPAVPLEVPAGTKLLPAALRATPSSPGPVGTNRAVWQATFTPATTKATARQRLFGILRNAPDDAAVDGFDLGQLNAMLARAEHLQAQGISLDHIRSLADFRAVPEATASEGIGLTLADRIHLDHRFRWQYNPGHGKATAYDDIGGLFAHEVGHTVWNGLGVDAQTRMLALYQRHAGDAARISDYATTSVDEWFGEAFATITAPGYQPGSVAFDTELWGILAADGKVAAVRAALTPQPPPLRVPELTLKPIDVKKPKLGGQSTKAIYTDAAGQDWLVKPKKAFAADVAKSRAAIEVEQAVKPLADMLGVEVAPISVHTIDFPWINGEPLRKMGVSAQPLIPGVKGLPLTPEGKVAFEELTDDQLNSLLEQQVLDWLIGNDDGHLGQFLIGADGRLIGIDKDAAFWEIASQYALGNSTPEDGLHIAHTIWDGMTAERLARIDPERIARLLDRVDLITPEEYARYIEPHLPILQAHPSGVKVSVEQRKAWILQRKLELRADFDGYYARQIAELQRAGVAVPDNWQAWLAGGGRFGESVPHQLPTHRAIDPARYAKARKEAMAARLTVEDVLAGKVDAAISWTASHSQRAVDAGLEFRKIGGLRIYAKDTATLDRLSAYLAQPGAASTDDELWAMLGYSKSRLAKLRRYEELKRPIYPKADDLGANLVPQPLPKKAWLEPGDTTIYDVPGTIPLNTAPAPWSGTLPDEPPLPAGLKASPAEIAAARAAADKVRLTVDDVIAGRADVAWSWFPADATKAKQAGLVYTTIGDARIIARSEADLAPLRAYLAKKGADAGDDAFWELLGYTTRELDIIDRAADIARGKRLTAGAMIVEPDGRVWIMAPRNKWAGYENTVIKGGADPGESAAQAAVREAWEEAGISIELDAYLGDYLNTDRTGITRMYIAHRTGGGPRWAKFKETYQMRLVTPDEAKKLLTRYGKPDARDQAILADTVTALGEQPGLVNYSIPADAVDELAAKLAPAAPTPPGIPDAPKARKVQHAIAPIAPEPVPAPVAFGYDGPKVNKLAAAASESPPADKFPYHVVRYEMPSGEQAVMYWRLDELSTKAAGAAAPDPAAVKAIDDAIAKVKKGTAGSSLDEEDFWLIADELPETAAPNSGRTLLTEAPDGTQMRVFGWYNEDGKLVSGMAAGIDPAGKIDEVKLIATAEGHGGKGYATRLADYIEDEGWNLIGTIHMTVGFTPAGRGFSLKWLEHRKLLLQTTAPPPSAAKRIFWANSKKQVSDPIEQWEAHVAQIVRHADTAAADPSIISMRVNNDLLAGQPKLRETLIAAGGEPVGKYVEIDREHLIALADSIKGSTALPAAPTPTIPTAPMHPQPTEVLSVGEVGLPKLNHLLEQVTWDVEDGADWTETAFATWMLPSGVSKSVTHVGSISEGALEISMGQLKNLYADDKQAILAAHLLDLWPALSQQSDLGAVRLVGAAAGDADLQQLWFAIGGEVMGGLPAGPNTPVLTMSRETLTVWAQKAKAELAGAHFDPPNALIDLMAPTADPAFSDAAIAALDAVLEDESVGVLNAVANATDTKTGVLGFPAIHTDFAGPGSYDYGEVWWRRLGNVLEAHQFKGELSTLQAYIIRMAKAMDEAPKISGLRFLPEVTHSMDPASLNLLEIAGAKSYPGGLKLTRQQALELRDQLMADAYTTAIKPDPAAALIPSPEDVAKLLAPDEDVVLLGPAYGFHAATAALMEPTVTPLKQGFIRYDWAHPITPEDVVTIRERLLSKHIVWSQVSGDATDVPTAAVRQLLVDRDRLLQNTNLEGIRFDATASLPQPTRSMLEHYGATVNDGVLYMARDDVLKLVGDLEPEIGALAANPPPSVATPAAPPPPAPAAAVAPGLADIAGGVYMPDVGLLYGGSGALGASHWQIVLPDGTKPVVDMLVSPYVPIDGGTVQIYAATPAVGVSSEEQLSAIVSALGGGKFTTDTTTNSGSLNLWIRANVFGEMGIHGNEFREALIAAGAMVDGEWLKLDAALSKNMTKALAENTPLQKAVPAAIDVPPAPITAANTGTPLSAQLNYSHETYADGVLMATNPGPATTGGNVTVAFEDFGTLESEWLTDTLIDGGVPIMWVNPDPSMVTDAVDSNFHSLPMALKALSKHHDQLDILTVTAPVGIGVSEDAIGMIDGLGDLLLSAGAKVTTTSDGSGVYFISKGQLGRLIKQVDDDLAVAPPLKGTAAMAQPPAITPDPITILNEPPDVLGELVGKHKISDLGTVYKATDFPTGSMSWALQPNKGSISLTTNMLHSPAGDSVTVAKQQVVAQLRIVDDAALADSALHTLYIEQNVYATPDVRMLLEAFGAKQSALTSGMLEMSTADLHKLRVALDDSIGLAPVSAASRSTYATLGGWTKEGKAQWIAQNPMAFTDEVHQQFLLDLGDVTIRVDFELDGPMLTMIDVASLGNLSPTPQQWKDALGYALENAAAAASSKGKAVAVAAKVSDFQPNLKAVIDAAPGSYATPAVSVVTAPSVGEFAIGLVNDLAPPKATAAAAQDAVQAATAAILTPTPSAAPEVGGILAQQYGVNVAKLKGLTATIEQQAQGFRKLSLSDGSSVRLRVSGKATRIESVTGVDETGWWKAIDEIGYEPGASGVIVTPKAMDQLPIKAKQLLWDSNGSPTADGGLAFITTTWDSMKAKIAADVAPSPAAGIDAHNAAVAEILQLVKDGSVPPEAAANSLIAMGYKGVPGANAAGIADLYKAGQLSLNDANAAILTVDPYAALITPPPLSDTPADLFLLENYGVDEGILGNLNKQYTYKMQGAEHVVAYTDQAAVDAGITSSTIGELSANLRLFERRYKTRIGVTQLAGAGTAEQHMAVTVKHLGTLLDEAAASGQSVFIRGTVVNEMPSLQTLMVDLGAVQKELKIGSIGPIWEIEAPAVAKAKETFESGVKAVAPAPTAAAVPPTAPAPTIPTPIPPPPPAGLGQLYGYDSVGLKNLVADMADASTPTVASAQTSATKLTQVYEDKWITGVTVRWAEEQQGAARILKVRAVEKPPAGWGSTDQALLASLESSVSTHLTNNPQVARVLVTKKALEDTPAVKGMLADAGWKETKDYWVIDRADFDSFVDAVVADSASWAKTPVIGTPVTGTAPVSAGAAGAVLTPPPATGVGSPSFIYDYDAAGVKAKLPKLVDTVRTDPSLQAGAVGHSLVVDGVEARWSISPSGKTVGWSELLIPAGASKHEAWNAAFAQMRYIAEQAAPREGFFWIKPEVYDQVPGLRQMLLDAGGNETAFPKLGTAVQMKASDAINLVKAIDSDTMTGLTVTAKSASDYLGFDPAAVALLTKTEPTITARQHIWPVANKQIKLTVKGDARSLTVTGWSGTPQPTAAMAELAYASEMGIEQMVWSAAALEGVPKMDKFLLAIGATAKGDDLVLDAAAINTARKIIGHDALPALLGGEPLPYSVIDDLNATIDHIIAAAQSELKSTVNLSTRSSFRIGENTVESTAKIDNGTIYWERVVGKERLDAAGNVVGKATPGNVRNATTAQLRSFLNEMAQNAGITRLDVDLAVLKAQPVLRDVLTKYGAVEMAPAGTAPFLSLERVKAMKLRNELEAELKLIVTPGANTSYISQQAALINWPTADELKVSTSGLAKKVLSEGQTRKAVVVDAAGNEWLFKPGASGRGSVTDRAAAQLAELLGLPVPPVRIYTLEIDGKIVTGSLQKLVPNAKGMAQAGTPTPGQLNALQTEDMFRHSILDWVTNNDDAHAGNWLVDESGHLWAIDKSRSWVTFNDGAHDVLNTASEGNGGGTPWMFLWWRQARQDPTLLNKVHPTTFASTFRRLVNISDDEYRRIVTPVAHAKAADPRTAGKYLGKPEKLIDDMVARKNSAVADFETYVGGELKAMKAAGQTLPPEWEQWLTTSKARFNLDATPRDLWMERKAYLDGKWGEFEAQKGRQLMQQNVYSKLRSAINSYFGSGFSGGADYVKGYGSETIRKTLTQQGLGQVVADWQELNEWALLNIVNGRPGPYPHFDDSVRKWWNPEKGTIRITRTTNRFGTDPNRYLEEYAKQGMRDIIGTSVGKVTTVAGGGGVILYLEVPYTKVFSQYNMGYGYGSLGSEAEYLIHSPSVSDIVHIARYDKGLQMSQWLDYNGPVVEVK